MRLNKQHVVLSETGTPAPLNIYAADVCGPGAVVRAVRELRAGLPAAFAVCDRLPEGSGNWPTVREIIRFAPMPGAACIRYAGEDGKPDSIGSSTVYGCGSLDILGEAADLDPVTVAAHLAAVLASKTHWYFLLKANNSMTGGVRR